MCLVGVEEVGFVCGGGKKGSGFYKRVLVACLKNRYDGHAFCMRRGGRAQECVYLLPWYSMGGIPL